MIKLPDLQPLRLKASLLLPLVLVVVAPAAFVTVRNDAGIWSFEGASGKFLSFGINSIRMTEYWPSGTRFADRKKLGYYNVRDRFVSPYHDWTDAIKQRFASWGFNTAGAWSSDLLERDGLLYCELLPMGWSGQPNRLVDLFDAAYETYADRIALRECQSRAKDTNLIGYFLDNELPWYGAKGWPTGKDSLLRIYSLLPATAAGRKKLLAFLQSRFASWDLFRVDFTTSATSWSELARSGAIAAATPAGKKVELAWTGEVATRFYSVAVKAIRRYDNNHLLLGSRFVANAPAEVWQAAADHCDVLSVNYYPAPGKPALERWRGVFALTGKPLLISETSLRAMQNRSGNKNTAGSGSKVATQEERADAFTGLLDAWLHEPFIVGVHWFEYADQPPGGRSHNGENSNYGLVDIHDQPYDALITVWRNAVLARTATIGTPHPATP